DRARFVHALAKRVSEIAQDDGDFSRESIAAAIASLHATDLYLAVACAGGDRTAVSFFDRNLLSAIDRSVATVHSAPQFDEEVRQKLRVDLLTGENGGPGKIANYAGRGPLGGWLRVVVVRTALNMRRGRGAPLAPEEEALTVGSAEPDPELDYLK